MARQKRFLSSQVIFGALVVLVGIILLADTIGLWETRPLFDYLPSLFVLLGLYAFVKSGFRNIFGPFVVVALAGAWQLVELDIMEWSELSSLWPLFLVLFGLSLILSQVRSRPTKTDSSQLTGVGLFSGSQKRVTTPDFENANLTAVFGGAELDLRDAEIPDPPAHVNCIALFGGVEIQATEEWNVEMDVLPVFGGASDERRRVERDHDEVDLVVSGFAAFGGIEVTG